jgi:hypothetical protein
MHTIPPDIQVIDNFCPQVEEVRRSAIAGGFGNWTPAVHQVGSGVYQGMGFMGHHQHMHRALCMALNRPVFPGSMFFRLTGTDTEKAYVHSDRESGDWTCVAYLSEHKQESGTGFFRHRRTGLREMPPFEEMQRTGVFESFTKEMVKGSAKDWEQLDFVRGIFNRALIFRAPLFHARCPKTGIGKNAEEGRLVWVCHFFLE